MNSRKIFTGKKLDIIEVSKKLFLSRGYDATSMSMILSELGMAKGTLYHHFKSKDEILMAVIKDIIDNERNKTKKLIDTLDFRNLKASKKLITLLKNADISEDNDNIIKVLHTQCNAHMQAKMLGYYIEIFSPIYSMVIIQGIEEGVFNTDFPLESAELIISGFQFLTDLGFYEWDTESLYRRANSMLSIIEKVIGADKGILSNIDD